MITPRSNGYRAGYAYSKRRIGTLEDNPYRQGTANWHDWRAGFTQGCQEFVEGLRKLLASEGL